MKLSWLSVLLICCLWFPPAVSAKTPQRIISGMPSITEMLFAIGAEDKIVGVTTNCNYPPAAKSKEKIGGYFLNLEKIIALKPDLIVMMEKAQKKDIQRIRDHGLRVYAINPASIDGIMQSILALGEIVGERNRAERLVWRMRQKIRKVAERKKRYRPALADIMKMWSPDTKEREALVIVGYDPLVAAGGGNFIDDIIRCSGMRNVAADSRAAYPHLSFEKLLRIDPACIIIPAGIIPPSKIFGDKRWQSLSAVRSKRVLFIDPDIIARPGPRVVDAIEKIAEFSYN